MNIMNKPNCQGKDCEDLAISLFLGKWLCGNCLTKYVEKEKRIRSELIFNE